MISRHVGIHSKLVGNVDASVAQQRRSGGLNENSRTEFWGLEQEVARRCSFFGVEAHAAADLILAAVKSHSGVRSVAAMRLDERERAANYGHSRRRLFFGGLTALCIRRLSPVLRSFQIVED